MLLILGTHRPEVLKPAVGDRAVGERELVDVLDALRVHADDFRRRTVARDDVIAHLQVSDPAEPGRCRYRLGDSHFFAMSRWAGDEHELAGAHGEADAVQSTYLAIVLHPALVDVVDHDHRLIQRARVILGTQARRRALLTTEHSHQSISHLNEAAATAQWICNALS